MKRCVSELLEIFREKARRPEETEPYWGCLTEPTLIEIGDAISSNRLTPWLSPDDDAKPEHNGNQEWHVGRIAWLAKNWNPNYLVEVSKDGKDIRGGHRVFAAYYKNIVELEVKLF